MAVPLTDRSRNLRPGDPLHLRFADDLKRRLQGGEWQVGQRLPTELELSEQYQISRVTVRTGMKLLESQGLLHTRQGAGTYVTSFGVRMEAGLQELRSLTETLRQQGLDPVVECIRAEEAPASAEAVAALELSPGDLTLHVERVFRARQLPVAFSYEELRPGVLPAGVSSRDLNGSLFELLRQAGNEPAYAAATIRPVHDAALSWSEEKSPNGLYLLVTQIHYSKAGSPISLSTIHFVDGRVEFSVMRTT